MGIQSRIAVGCLGLTMTLSPSAFAAVAPPSPAPANAPAEETISEAEKSLLLQLADAEANIKALNIALARTGYKVGQAYNRIDSGEKGNSLMDRKGGGPVGWSDFYGKTARDFQMPDSETKIHSQGGGRGTVDIHATAGNHPIQRPAQFDFIYKANNDQVARAKEQVAALAQDQATLLARRQKHEADQSQLWAMLAFSRVADREIADEPLCRFKLKTSSAQDEGRVPLVRAIVLYLRTADAVAAAGLDGAKIDQAAAFSNLDPTMKSAYATLRASLADALPTANLQSPDKKKVDELKTICKQLWDESSIIADNYRNALDRDQAKEDNSKLVFREKLQESLSKFAAATAELHVQTLDLAKSWSITVVNGVSATDQPSLVVAVRPDAARDSSSPIPAQQKPFAPNGAEKIVLFDGTSLSHWDAKWPISGGVMRSDRQSIYTRETFTNFQMHLEFNEPPLPPNIKSQQRGNSGIFLQNRYELQILDSFHNDTYAMGGCGAVFKAADPLKNMSKPPGQWQTYDLTFHAAKYQGGRKIENARLTLIWNGELVQDNIAIPEPSPSLAHEADTPGPIGLQYFRGSSVQFRNIWVSPIR